MFLAFIPYILQLALIFHAIKRSKSFNWIWLLVIVPYIGGVLYIFLELIPDLRDEQGHNIKDLGKKLNPGKDIKNLEMEYELSKTPANKLRLAQAYAKSGMFLKASVLYEDLLTGYFKNDYAVTCLCCQVLLELKDYQKIYALFLPFAEKNALLSIQDKMIFYIAAYQVLKEEKYLKLLEDLFYSSLDFELGYRLSLLYLELSEKSKIPLVLEKMNLQKKLHKNFKKTLRSEYLRKTEKLLA